MRAIQTSVHVGSDGVLRLEVPVAEKDRQVDVIVLLQAQEESAARAVPAAVEPGDSEWARVIGPSIAPIRFPAPGSWNTRTVQPLEPRESHLSASEMLVRDRR